jgi:hypothetical protein
MHGRLLDVFSHGFALHEAGDRAGLNTLIDFPEGGASGLPEPLKLLCQRGSGTPTR